MSVDWGVVPAQPTEAGFCEWLSAAGLEIPKSQSRFPTLDELLSVLRSFEGLTIRKEGYGEASYSISLGEPYSESYAYILGSIKNNLFHFHFFGSGNQNMMMLDILKRLARICGTFILYESYAATPVIVEEHTDLEQAVIDWIKRSQQNYKDMAK